MSASIVFGSYGQGGIAAEFMAIPEPGTFTLAALGLKGFVRRRK